MRKLAYKSVVKEGGGNEVGKDLNGDRFVPDVLEETLHHKGEDGGDYTETDSLHDC